MKKLYSHHILKDYKKDMILNNNTCTYITCIWLLFHYMDTSMTSSLPLRNSSYFSYDSTDIGI